MKNKIKKRSFLANIGLGQEREHFMENFAMLQGSGMGILTALNALKIEMRSKRMRKIIDWMISELGAGANLSDTLEKTALFSNQIVTLIRIGEEAGRLKENLQVISLQQRKDRIFKSKLRSAIMYPVFVLTLTLIVGVSISWFILPRLALVFSGLNVDLPLVTKILINLGSFLGEHGIVVIPIFLLVTMLMLFFTFFFSKTKIIGQIILLHIPAIKKLIKQLELARFGYIFGTLLQAGLPLMDSLNSLKESTPIRVYQKLYDHLSREILDGNSFQKCFASYKGAGKLIPPSIQQLIIAGEKAGTLPETLVQIGESYEAKVETTTKNLSVILEPILLVIVWIGVVSVALAVILPIYSLIGNFNA